MKIQSMKFYILLGLSLILSNVFCSKLSKGIVFLNVQSEYRSNEKITFNLKNSSDTSYQYYVDLDAFYAGSWHPATLNDIDTAAPLGAAIVKHLPSHTTIHVEGGPLYFMLTKSNSKKDETTSYRLVLHYRLENNTDFFGKIYSKKFIFK